MGTDDGKRRRQSQPGPSPLGGEERIPGSLQDRRLHPSSIVLDNNQTTVLALRSDSSNNPTCPSFGGRRLQGVLNNGLKCIVQGFRNTLHAHRRIRWHVQV